MSFSAINAIANIDIDVAYDAVNGRGRPIALGEAVGHVGSDGSDRKVASTRKPQKVRFILGRQKRSRVPRMTFNAVELRARATVVRIPTRRSPVIPRCVVTQPEDVDTARLS